MQKNDLTTVTSSENKRNVGNRFFSFITTEQKPEWLQYVGKHE